RDRISELTASAGTDISEFARACCSDHKNAAWSARHLDRSSEARRLRQRAEAFLTAAPSDLLSPPLPSQAEKRCRQQHQSNATPGYLVWDIDSSSPLTAPYRTA